MSEHTPTPWRYTGVNDGFILAADDTRVAQTFNRMDEDFANCAENGEFIVRAVNCHADLLAACQELVAARDRNIDARGADCTVPRDGEDGRYTRARAAIAKSLPPRDGGAKHTQADVE